MKLACYLNLALCLVSASAEIRAQDDSDSLDEVVVTGSRISYKDLSSTPAIGIVKAADSITQGFSLECDTRDRIKRLGELQQSLKSIVDRADGRYAVETHEGVAVRASAQAAAGDSTSASALTVEWADAGKVDSSIAHFRLRANLKDRANRAAGLVGEMQKLLNDVVRAGRTELSIELGTALSISKPERFRYELLGAIATDMQKVRQAMGSNCEVSLGGLNPEFPLADAPSLVF